MTHVSESLATMADELERKRDSEVSALAEALPQYVTDHNDKDAYREIDRKVNALARAFDRIIEKLKKWEGEALKIENSVDSFYGD